VLRHILFATTLATIGAGAEARPLRNGGKLMLTGGATGIEGAAGGGLATWALIGGNETDAGIGGGVHATEVRLADFGFRSLGAKVGLFDRVELSYAHHRFDTEAAGAALGLGRGFTFGQQVFGAKVRLVGDAIYDQGSVLPHISVAVQHKRARRDGVIAFLGGRSETGTDYLVSASKILLDQSLVLGGSVRLTKANQFGLLGFGGDKEGGYSAQFEGSAGVLLSRKLLVGAELRTRPSNLSFAREDDAWDAFAAWSVHRNVTLTAAYVDLGSIATLDGQRGLYLSAQLGF
jgi:hypothetical protein